MKGTRTLIAGLLASVLTGCGVSPDADSPRAAKVPQAAEPVQVQGVPDVVLRPASDPWGGAVLPAPGGKLLAVALHEDDALGVWHIGADRQVREVGVVKTGYHPDSVAALTADTVAVAVEGTSELRFWRVSADRPPQWLKTISTPFPVREVVAHDLDGDGRRDLVIAPYNGARVSVLWQEGELDFSAPLDLAAALTPWFPRVTDWNGDGRPDLVWSDWDTGSVRLYLNEGARRFTLRMLQEAQEGRPRQAGVGDVDGDGKPDVVLAQETGRAARVLYNRGADTPQVAQVRAPSWGYSSAEVMVDGTLVLGEEGKLLLARRNGDGWMFRRLVAGSLPSPLHLSDLDGDGVEDLVVFNALGLHIHFGPLWDKATPVSNIREVK